MMIAWGYAVGVAAALAVYHSLGPRARKYWLLVVSYVFYAIWSWQFVPVLALLTVATHLVARRLPRGRPSRNQWLWAGIALNIAALGGLRYLFRAQPFLGPFVVVGVSFYSLQAMSYLWDVHSGRLKAAASLADVAIYLAYFPKLPAGPLERAPIFLARLARPQTVDDQTVARATTLIAIGLMRKLVIADPLNALLPAGVFSSPADFDAAVLAASVVGYAFVLYNDFAGYTSIARGVSSLFGIELSPNFAQPFFARSFTEFWNRWHITLSHWLRDYVYMPLSRRLLRRNLTRWNVPNLVVPPMVTMLLCGLWHGANVHMLLWGGLHGVYLVVERLVALIRPAARGRRPSPWRAAAAAVAVFVLGCWAFVPFRMETDAALHAWRRLLMAPLGDLPDPGLAVPMLLSFALDAIQLRHGEETAFAPWPRLARAGLMASAVVLWFFAVRPGAPAAFIYQGF